MHGIILYIGDMDIVVNDYILNKYKKALYYPEPVLGPVYRALKRGKLSLEVLFQLLRLLKKGGELC